jgi:hypothetical protein
VLPPLFLLSVGENVNAKSGASVANLGCKITWGMESMSEVEKKKGWVLLILWDSPASGLTALD